MSRGQTCDMHVAGVVTGPCEVPWYLGVDASTWVQAVATNLPSSRLEQREACAAPL